MVDGMLVRALTHGGVDVRASQQGGDPSSRNPNDSSESGKL